MTFTASTQTPDLALVGGIVHTFDRGGHSGEAVAVRDGQVVVVGDRSTVLASVSKDAVVIELDGRAVIPGINDSHLHGAWFGACWPNVMVSGTAMNPSFGPVKLSSADQRRAAILRAQRTVSSLGITSYTEPGLGPGEDDGESGCFGNSVIEAYQALAAAGRLTARVTALALYGRLDGATDRQFFEREIAGLAGASPDQRQPSWFHINGVKIFADGIPPMRSAWISGRYDDGTSGQPLVDGATTAERGQNLRALVRCGHELGLQVAVHATGDRAIEAVIDAVRDDPARTRQLRHYVIHGDLARDDQLHVMAELGIGLNLQPSLVAPMTPPMEAVLPGVDIWPFARARARGLEFCLSSDAPILMPDWRVGIADAARLLGGGGSDLVEQLLRAYTVSAAMQDGAESWKGTLEPGKVADMCVLSDDPLSVSPSRIPDIMVDLTVCDGRVVFDRTPDHSAASYAR